MISVSIRRTAAVHRSRQRILALRFRYNITPVPCSPRHPDPGGGRWPSRAKQGRGGPHLGLRLLHPSNATNSLKSLLSIVRRTADVLLAQEFDGCQSLFRRSNRPVRTVVPDRFQCGDPYRAFHAPKITDRALGFRVDSPLTPPRLRLPTASKAPPAPSSSPAFFPPCGTSPSAQLRRSVSLRRPPSLAR